MASILFGTPESNKMIEDMNRELHEYYSTQGMLEGEIYEYYRRTTIDSSILEPLDRDDFKETEENFFKLRDIFSTVQNVNDILFGFASSSVMIAGHRLGLSNLNDTENILKFALQSRGLNQAQIALYAKEVMNAAKPLSMTGTAIGVVLGSGMVADSLSRGEDRQAIKDAVLTSTGILVSTILASQLNPATGALYASLAVAALEGTVAIGVVAALSNPLVAAVIISSFTYIAVKAIDENWPAIEALARNVGESTDSVINSTIDIMNRIFDNTEGVDDYIKDQWNDFANSFVKGVVSLPSDMQDLLAKIFVAEQTASPLVLDLDGDGIELSATGAAGSVYFDLDNDGFGEATGWVRGGDGLLAMDRNGNGVIDNKSELFGDTGTAVNGFENLKTLDSNLDGRITSLDQKFANLRVWIDANGDGISQASELRTLSSLGITAINTGYTDVNKTNAGHAVLQEGTFMRNGITRQIADVWFTADQANTEYLKD